jgi:hypothetical protein
MPAKIGSAPRAAGTVTASPGTNQARTLAPAGSARVRSATKVTEQRASAREQAEKQPDAGDFIGRHYAGFLPWAALHIKRIDFATAALLCNVVEPDDLVVSHGLFRRGLEVIAVAESLFLKAFLGADGGTAEEQERRRGDCDQILDHGCLHSVMRG